MAVGDTHVFPGFLTPVQTQLFFPKPLTTFLTCFCRGERQKYAGKKSRLNRGSNSQPPGHESNTLTTEPPGWGTTTLRILIEWCFMPLSTVFQSYHGNSSHNSCLSWVSPVLGWGSEVSYSKTIPQKNPADPLRLEPRTPGLYVKHFTTEPRRTPTLRINNSNENSVSKEKYDVGGQHLSTSPIFSILKRSTHDLMCGK